MARNPMVTIDLRLEDRFVDLVEEGIDVALRISVLSDSSLIARKIIDLRHAVYGAPKLVERVGKPATADALRNMPCVIDTNMPAHTSWRFARQGKPVTVHVAGPVRVNSPVAAMQAATASLGFALLPSYLAEPQVAAGRLIEVLTDEMPDGPSLRAVYPHRRHLAGKVRGLIDHLVAWFAANPVR
jgi:DNA-binding transcriptional LysR family regulator